MGLPELKEKYTIDDYRQWDGDWELIEGTPYAMAPSPLAKHQLVCLLLGTLLEEQLRDCPEKCYVFPELDWIIDQNTVVRPDLSLVCHEVEDYLKEPPLIVVEVVSPNTAQRDEILKFALYEREKVPYFVLVYPGLRKTRIFFLKNGKYTKVFDGERGSFSFEGLPCPLKIDFERLWQRL